MHISVVIANYNYRHFVTEAVDSVLEQEVRPGEIIIVDDGSTDGSVEHLRQRYAGRSEITLLERPNRGVVAAVHEGVERASGEVIALLDPDDVWKPDHLRKVVEVYARRPDISYVSTGMELFGMLSGRYGMPGPSRELGLSVLLGAFRIPYQGSPTSALTLRRSLALQILSSIPPDLRAQFKARVDFPLTLGADIFGARKYHIAEATVLYRAHDTNTWLAKKRSGGARLQDGVKERALVHHFRQLARIEPDMLALVKHEFRSRPSPTWRDFWRYQALLSMAPLHWYARLAQRLSLLTHMRRTRARRDDGPRGMRRAAEATVVAADSR